MTGHATHVTFTSTPTVQEVASVLSRAVPDGDRLDATRLLADEILPWELRALEDHPRPTALAQAVFDDLQAALSRRPPADRLAVLRARALRVRVGRAGAAAVDLAIQRYALDHPARAERAAARLADPAARSLSRQETVARATALVAALDALEREEQASSPEGWEADRLDLHFARLAAGSAATGSFATAAGPLADVLRELGEHPAVLEVH